MFSSSIDVFKPDNVFLGITDLLFPKAVVCLQCEYFVAAAPIVGLSKLYAEKGVLAGAEL